MTHNIGNTTFQMCKKLAKLERILPTIEET